MLRNPDVVHSARAEARTGRNPHYLLSAQRGLDSFCQSKNLISLREANGSRAECPSHDARNCDRRFARRSR
jgi:hypothetical protein